MVYWERRRKCVKIMEVLACYQEGDYFFSPVSDYIKPPNINGIVR